MKQMQSVKQKNDEIHNTYMGVIQGRSKLSQLRGKRNSEGSKSVTREPFGRMNNRKSSRPNVNPAQLIRTVSAGRE